MKKLFVCMVLAGILVSGGCAKKEEDNQTKQVKQVARVEKKVAKPSFPYPLFDTYRVGEKFVNRGYEGKKLVQDSPFSYRAVLDKNGIIEVIIMTTKDGTIAGILKSYYLDRGLRDLAKIFEKKLNITFQEKGAFGFVAMYLYEGKDARISVSTKSQNLSRWVRELNDYTGVAEVEVMDTKLFNQVNKEMEELAGNALQEQADNFKI